MKSIKKWHCFLVILLYSLLPCNYTYGQQEGEITWKDRLYFGFDLEPIIFGDVTSIAVAPLVGYRITPRWSTGIGLKYEYYKASVNFGDFSTSIYGGNVFTSYIIWKDFLNQGISLIAHCEYEALSLERKYFEDPLLTHGRFIMNSVLVGGGIKQRLGGRVSMNMLILLNLNQTDPSPYSNPTVLFNVNF